MKKQKNNPSLLKIFIAVPIINYLGSFIAGTLGLPIFFDSLGTVLGVVFGGLLPGLLGGITYNLLSAILSGQYESSIWSLANAFIALVVWHLLKTKKLDLGKYESVFTAGIVLAALNSVLTTIISLVFFQGAETFPPAVTLQGILAGQFPNNQLSIILAHLLIELLDKSLVLLVVFWIYGLVKRKKSPGWNVLAKPVAVLTAVIFFTAWINIHEKNDQKKQAMDLLIINQTQQAVSMLGTVYDGYKDGMYTLDQAKNMAADLLRYLRYGDNNEGYFWADTSDGTNVVLYGRKDVEGKNRMNSTVCGIDHVREIIANGKQPGGGYTDYYYPKKDGSRPLAKRGYSIYFQPFDWIVGTGYYLEDLDK